MKLELVFLIYFVFAVTTAINVRPDSDAREVTDEKVELLKEGNQIDSINIEEIKSSPSKSDQENKDTSEYQELFTEDTKKKIKTRETPCKQEAVSSNEHEEEAFFSFEKKIQTIFDAIFGKSLKKDVNHKQDHDYYHGIFEWF